MLEVLQARQKVELKVMLKATKESLTPWNLIKGTFNDIKESPDLKTNLLNAAIGLTTGFVTKKVLIGGSHNPLLRILGTLVEVGVAGAVAKHPDGLKSAGLSLFKKIFSRVKG